MSNNPALRTVRLPSANFNELKIPRTRQLARTWFRVHPTRFSALYFSLNPGHRFSHKDSPYPFLYLAADVDTCLFERFGDKAYGQQKTIPHSLWAAHSVTSIQVPEHPMCDLTNAKTLSALMVDLGAMLHNDLTTPQEWGLAIQRHTIQFQGIKYKSRFNGKACLALFQRDGIETRLRETSREALLDSETAVDWLDEHRVSLY